MERTLISRAHVSSLIAGAAGLFALSGCSQGPDTSGGAAPIPLGAISTQSLAKAAPDGKVMTPGGPRDARCVHVVPEGVIVDYDLNTYDKGKLTGRFEPCPTPPVPGNANWVEDTAAFAQTFGGVSYFTKMTVQFVVPKSPTTNHAQEIYLFPSLSSYQEILQPVLTYAPSSWVLQNIYVSNGSVIGTPTSMNVNPNDSLSSTLTLTDGTPATYDVWQITTTDTTTGQSTQATYHTHKGGFSQAESGVLEAYSLAGGSWVNYLQQCTDYPASSTLFGNVYVQQANGAWNNPINVTPSWANCVNGTGTNHFCSAQPKDCGFTASGGSTGTTLGY
jgi:hypothetical protein